MSNSLPDFSVLSPVHLKAAQLTGKSSMEGEKRMQMEIGGREAGELLTGGERQTVLKMFVCVTYCQNLLPLQL